MRLLLLFLLISIVTSHNYRKNSKNLKLFPLDCSICPPLAAAIGILPSESVIIFVVKQSCKWFMQPYEVCEGIIDQFSENFVYVYSRLADHPSRICAALMPHCGDPTDELGEGWKIDLPPLPANPLPSPVSPPRASRLTKKQDKPDVLRVLQIGDTHVDFSYQEGSEAECANPACCRNTTYDKDGRVANSVSAGYWGTVGKCDIPFRTLEHMLKHISEKEEISYIMISGDLINHVVWHYKWDNHVQVIRNMSSLFKKYFPITPTYWALGNHEGVPVDSFPTHQVDQKFWPTKLYDELTEMNKPWVKEDSEESSRYRGSWSAVVTKGIRLISINTGYCVNTNIFIYLNQSDPDGTKENFVYVYSRLADHPSRICAALMPHCGDPTDELGEGWKIDLPPLPANPLPSPVSPPRASRLTKKQDKPDVLRVLQIGDTHVDFSYQEGSEAECANPACCRNTTYDKDGRVANSVSAGYWGTVGKCDIPFRTLEHMLKHISEKEEISYIMISGDLINHVVWHYKWDNHVQVIRNMSSLFKKYFPITPTYWALGNHEGVPVDSFPTHQVDQKFWPTKLYDELTEMNKPWVKEDSEESSRYRGSWSAVVTKGIRLISINTGYCVNTNIFIYLNQSDPDGTMSWFVEELRKAEERGEFVHVLAHIPSSANECLEGWSRNYYRVIQRFSETITAQFFGHMHYDYFTVFYEDMNDINSKPINVAYVSPSATTFEYLNPAYRIYTVDPLNTFRIIDHETYFANLTTTSKNVEPEWKLLYSAKKEFGMKDLSPSSWHDLAHSISTNATLEERFVQLSYRTSSPICDSACRRELLCMLRSGHHNDGLYCPTNRLKTNRVN